MAGGKENFDRPVPFTYSIDGSINGKKFSVEGKGVGDSNSGTLKGKYRCTTGQCPMSWQALAPILGYGMKVFCNYPTGLPSFFQETMPSGYSEDRVFRYEDGGVIKSHREITMENGQIVSKGSFVAENFPEDSLMMTQKLKSPFPPMEVVSPYKNGIRSLCNYVFPTETGIIYSADCTSIDQPLKDSSVTRPGPHYQRLHVKQTKDLDANDDAVIQEENLEAYQCSLVDNVYNV